MLVRMKAAPLVLALAGIAGCGGSLSTPDGGTGKGGAGGGGTGLDADAGPGNLRFGLDASAATSAPAKTSCRIYSYDRRWSSVFGGGSSTEVEIQHDVPTRRRYSNAQGDGGVSSPLTVVWDERGDMVGQNTTSYTVFPPSTVEQLFVECAMVLAHDPLDYFVSLTTDDRGVTC